MCTLTVLALIVGAIALCAYAASRFDSFDSFDRDLTDEACYGLDRTRHTAREHKEDHP